MSKQVESVWDYPRPPALDESGEHVTVEFGGRIIADTHRPIRILETSHPPTYYLPLVDVDQTVLRRAEGQSWCEFKGAANYFDIAADGEVAARAAWYYLQPTPGYARLAGHVAIYAGRVSRCTVDGEVVRVQEGDFYGGWITDRITGPFKGAPGTRGW